MRRRGRVERRSLKEGSLMEEKGWKQQRKGDDKGRKRRRHLEKEW